MAALNFPDSPNVNDVFTVGSREWIWDGSAWVSNSGREYTRLISDTAPSSPIEGDEWFNSSTGKLYIYYDSYWLEVGASVSGVDGTDGVDGTNGADGADGADATLTRTIRSESADTSLVSGDANQVIRFTGTSAQVLTVDDVLSVGDRVEVIQDNSGQVEFSSGSGVTLLSTTGGFGSSGQNAKVEVMCVAAGEYRLYGDLGALAVPSLEYLVIAGGGGGGHWGGGSGGGAGGYRSSVIDELSGGSSVAEDALVFGEDIAVGTNYSVTIGAGGAGLPSGSRDQSSNSGSSSSFINITTVGGGGGGGNLSGETGKNGGSGGGVGGTGTTNQGFNGGNTGASGGGGAGGVGGDSAHPIMGDGGIGISSSITGSSVGRAGGGAGGAESNQTQGTAVDGGGNGGLANSAAGGNGTTNTGGGGGGAGRINISPWSAGSGSGGSGVVILRYPSDYTITIGSGLTGTESTDGSFKYAEITAGTGNVSFS